MYSLIVTAKMNDIDPKPSLPTFLPGLPSIRSKGSTNCFRGIGATGTKQVDKAA
jgi:hypothetical protein